MIRNVQAGKELVVISENKVGTLSTISKMLVDQGINIVAISAQAAGGVALVNLVVSKTEAAVGALRSKGFQVQENNVVLVEVEDKPGALRDLTQKLSGEKVDLLNIYGSTAGSAPCLLVISSSDNKKALSILGGK